MGWSGGNVLDLYLGGARFGSNLGRDTGYPEWRIKLFSLHAVAGIIPHLGQDRFLPNNFQFINHHVSHHLTLYSLEIESAQSTKKNKKFWEELIAYFPWYDTGHIENDASKNSSIVACVFITAVTFLPSRCLATIGAFLPSRCLATIKGIYRHKHREQRDIISLFYIFFKIRKVG
jgi:hypothetical protein